MQNKYVKPMIIFNDTRAESVYMASGTAPIENANTTTPENDGPKCDSIYMKGVWQAPDYSDWNGHVRGYKKQFGCLGCPAYTWNACGLQTHYVDSGNASSYDVDNGNRKPSWEKKGYGPDEEVSDWAM